MQRKHGNWNYLTRQVQHYNKGPHEVKIDDIKLPYTDELNESFNVFFLTTSHTMQNQI